MRNFDWAEITRAGADLVAHIVANSEHIGRAAARDFNQVRDEATSAFNATMGDIREAGRSFRASPRYLQLAKLAARVLARHRLALARAELGVEDAIERAHSRSAVDVREVCAELGGGILKVGQLLSARPDLLPEAFITELSKLQDDAPPEDFEAIEEVLAGDLGDRYDGIAIDPKSLAAASLAQVHAATLADGRRVVFKVRRPGVDELVAADLRALRVLTRVFRDSLVGVDVDTVLAEVSRFLLEELDFNLEADRLARFSVVANGDSRWHVPEPIVEFSGPRVIAMERIDGSSLSAYLGAAKPEEVARVISTLIEVLASQVLGSGLAHGDPHPGNILIGKDGQIVFVDFGCVLELSADERSAYVALVMAIMSRNPQSISAALARAGFRATNSDAMVNFAELFLEAFEPGKLADIDTKEQMDRALGLAREAGDISVPASFVLIARIFGLVGGLVIHYRPTIDLAPLLSRVLQQASANARCAS